MAAASRYGSMMLSRVASRPAFATPLAFRPFSTSPLALQGKNDQPARSNPLVGNFTVPKRAQPPAEETPSVSTEQPDASQSPSLSDGANSSAEVPPIADMPPPPPPPPASAAEPETAASKPATSGSKFNLDISQVISNAAERYASAHNQIVNPMQQHRVRTAAATGRTIFLPEGAAFKQLKGFHPVARSPEAAFETLNKAIFARYKIKKISIQQYEHERAGLKRKRLRSERWRKRFLGGFRATTTRVRELKRQGW